MFIYNYDPVTGELIDSKEANLDPLESAKQKQAIYLIPAHATAEPPPDLQPGFARCFTNGEWVQVEDHRGKKAYSIADAIEVEVDYLGMLKQGYTLLPPCEFPKWNGSEWIVDVDLQAETMRGKRDCLLKASDCTMLEDHPTGKKQEWKTYRQALRDVPSQVGFPDNITWPTKPG